MYLLFCMCICILLLFTPLVFVILLPGFALTAASLTLSVYAFNLWKEIFQNLTILHQISSRIFQLYFSAEHRNGMLLTCEKKFQNLPTSHQISSQAEAWENVKWDLHFIPEYKSIDSSCTPPEYFQENSHFSLWHLYFREDLISHIPPKSEWWIILLWSN